MSNFSSIIKKNLLSLVVFFLIGIVLLHLLSIGVYSSNENLVISGYDNGLKELTPFQNLLQITGNLKLELLNIPILIIFSILRVFFSVLTAEIIFIWGFLMAGAIAIFVLTKLALREFFSVPNTKDLNLFASLASIFYLFSLGGLQGYLYLSTYSIISYGMFPILLLTLLWYLKKPSFRRIVLLLVINWLIMPLFKSFTGIFTYLFFLIIFSIIFYVKTRFDIKILIKFLVIVIIFNLFFVLLYISALINNGSTVQAVIDIRFTDIIFLKLPIITNDTFNETSGIILAFKALKNNYALSFVQSTHLWLLAISGIGLLVTIFKFKKRIISIGISILIFVAILYPIILRLNVYNTFFSSEFFPHFWPIIIGFYAVLFSLGSYYLVGVFNKIFPIRLDFTFIASLIFLIYLTILPVFTTGIINSNLKFNIPTEYFELANWLKKSSYKNIFSLPLGYSNGLITYQYGYLGSTLLNDLLPTKVFSNLNFSTKENYLQFWSKLNNYIAEDKIDQLIDLLDVYGIELITVDKNVQMDVAIKNRFFNDFVKMLEKNSRVLFLSSFGDSLKLFRIRK